MAGAGTERDKYMKEQTVNITCVKDRYGKVLTGFCFPTGVQPSSMRHPGAGRTFPDIPVRKLRILAQR